MIQDTSVTLLLRSQNIHVEFAPNWGLVEVVLKSNKILVTKYLSF